MRTLVRRPSVVLLIAAGVFVFVVISLLLARALAVGGSERSKVTSAVKAEARGDAAAVRRALDGCAPTRTCAARAAALAGRLHHPGEVRVLTFAPSASFALSGGSGVARVAWRAGDGFAVVQCASIRRTGDVIRGMKISVVALSDPIPRESGCPGE